ncbi:hypothetical protein [Halorussus sp. MSC15.2]|uniref:hypothetical protein n=1 Tax=Halorussus sp. MSC15.2 TaxID=2283638 RepID=UPI001F07DCE4|nr:hypothetical protein [Halorussus sp. MSC15.2]
MDAEISERTTEATYPALCEYGHADPTMQRVANESPLSKATTRDRFDGNPEVVA